ncbi:unnamed protein product, partial [Rotaria sp. Silwood2]
CSCYEFAYEIGKRNLPLCHPMILVRLERNITNLIKQPSCNKERLLAIREAELLPLLEQALCDINDDDNVIIADTIRDIGFQYAEYGIHENAKFYFERCMPIYRQQLLIDEMSLHRCQAYLIKQELSLHTTFLTSNQGISIYDINFSAMYKKDHPSDAT